MDAEPEAGSEPDYEANFKGLLWRGLTSFELATSGTVRFALRAGPVILRLLRG